MNPGLEKRIKRPEIHFPHALSIGPAVPGSLKSKFQEPVGGSPNTGQIQESTHHVQIHAFIHHRDLSQPVEPAFNCLGFSCQPGLYCTSSGRVAPPLLLHCRHLSTTDRPAGAGCRRTEGAGTESLSASCFNRTGLHRWRSAQEIHLRALFTRVRRTSDRHGRIRSGCTVLCREVPKGRRSTRWFRGDLLPALCCRNK